MRLKLLAAVQAVMLLSSPTIDRAVAAEPASAPSVLPSTLSRFDEQAIRQVVQAQLDAFAADDAVAAFRFATPALRRQFGTALHFMDVVKNGYPVVYRPARVVFLKPERSADGVAQGLRLTDDDGRAWLATYQMEQQPDKTWRIGGVVVTRDAALGT